MKRPLQILLLAALFAAGTLLLGWWTLPIIAAAYALLKRDRTAPRDTMLAATFAWIFLLSRSMSAPAFSTLLERLGRIFPLPGIGVLLLTLVLAMLLSWSAARVITGFTASTRT